MTTRTIIGVIAGCLWWTGAYAQAPDQVTYFHTDAFGSVRVVTDATGAVVQRHDYLPFGEEYPTQPPDRRLFAGKERDQETAFDYFGARYYAGGTGRFTTPDDPSYMDLSDPQSMNRYAYVYNNPLRFVDSTGHSGDCVGGYDSKTGLCEPTLDSATFWWLWNRLTGIGTAAQEVAQPVTNFLTAPRDPTCLAGSAVIGASVGGFAGGILGGGSGGAGGAFGGTLVAPGVGTIGGGFVGGTTGFAQGTAFGALAGTVVGGAVGSIACMGGVNGGGGAGDLDHMTADEILARYKKGSVRQVFPGEHLNKTLAEIRRLATAGDRAARTALKLLTDSRFDK
jgi:RHS repeat-associated protein